MDKLRQIRWLHPPLILLGFFWWYYDPNLLKEFMHYLHPVKEVQQPPVPSTSLAALIGIFATGGVVVIAMGYIMNTITIALLKIYSFKNKFNYELHINKKSRERIWKQFKYVESPADYIEDEIKYHVYAGFTFDHEKIPEGVHLWILRRWNAFNLSASTVVSLFLLMLFALIKLIIEFIINLIKMSDFKVKCNPWWWVLIAFVIVSNFIVARCAWKDTMKMIEFQSLRDFSPVIDPNGNTQNQKDDPTST